MSAGSYDVCIVSSSCVASGPRVEKEADALAAAGYRVAVLASHTLAWMTEWDERLARERRWDLHALDWLPGTRRRTALGLSAAALHAAARRACERAPAPGSALAALACSERALPLGLRAARIPARLYVAHNLGALPAAALAARARGARYAFDAEDDHFGELSREQQQGAAGRIVDAVMGAYLPGAAYVTAASDGIGEAIAARHGLAPPTTLLNVFPLHLRERLDGQRKDRRGDGLSLCWYSQSVGLDRGLQDAIAALGMVRGDLELHIRGHAPKDTRAELEQLAREHGVAARLFFHPQAHPDELLSRVAEHDVGLALEQPSANDNRSIAVTNKLFFYMLAGVAIVATATPGQAAIARAAGDAIATYKPGDAAALAACLQALADDRARLEARKRTALELARTRFNAEFELRELPRLIERALDRS